MNSSLFPNKKLFPACISLCLAFCLIFSSLSVYLIGDFFNQENTDFSSLNANHISIHHTPLNSNNLIAELIDSEEEEDDYIHKKKKPLLSNVLRILWSYSFIETDNLFAVQYTETPVLKIAEPYYIEFCSLKIPS